MMTSFLKLFRMVRREFTSLFADLASSFAFSSTASPIATAFLSNSSMSLRQCS